MKKNTPFNMILVLTLTAVFVGGMLAGFFKFVEPKIEENRLREERQAVFSVLPNVADYRVIEKRIDKKDVVKIFRGVDKDGKLVGYAFLASGPGFQGIITMMVGLNVDMKHLTGLKVLEQVETPGLGDKIREKWFEDQFKELSIEPKIEYIKNRKPEKPNQIQSITGATITTKAVTNIINKRVRIVIDIIKETESQTNGG